MIKSNFNTEYHAPKCKVIALCPGAMCLEATSRYGDAGKAGSQGSYITNPDEDDF